MTSEAFDTGLVLSDVQPADVALVEPAVTLLGEHAGEAVAIEIDPLIAAAVDAVGQIVEAVDICVADCRIDVGQRVLEVQGR